MKDPPALTAGVKKVRYFDTAVRGFFVELRASCATFYFRYTDERGRKPETKLGRYGDVTVD